ncbi:Hypothetical Protein FCC1311_053432 [Hondaea fermentalgiana]|uniref:Uncharacterized protein n=1 Tax=Hondaea fermentalgiana TaxID=2315210 RepID=A0A2R5GDV8_9STRA|nr:Hypothetical Protein FCC1311_053432 [Hondaea fermentalgiana]|eukprot:GBG29120.1 Hypothetical Protein FCC1311_053432 [Hondaea fermentalgiana]
MIRVSHKAPAKHQQRRRQEQERRARMMQEQLDTQLRALEKQEQLRQEKMRVQKMMRMQQIDEEQERTQQQKQQQQQQLERLPEETETEMEADADTDSEREDNEEKDHIGPDAHSSGRSCGSHSSNGSTSEDDFRATERQHMPHMSQQGKTIPTSLAPQDAAEADDDFMQQMIMPANGLLMPTANECSGSESGDDFEDDLENDDLRLVNEDVLGDIDDGADEDHEDDSREPSEAELEEYKPRMLRKRVRSRGHGSLDLDDIDDAQAVDLNDIDLENKDISYEFGNAGDMPVDQRSLWHVDRKFKPDESRIFSLGLTGGHYRFVLHNSMSRSASWIGDARGLLVKFWIVNKELGHSVVRRTERVDATCPELEFDFVIGSKDCVSQPMELRVQVVSSCKHTLSKASLELRKVKLSSSYDVLAVSETTRPERCLLLQGRSASIMGLNAMGAAGATPPKPMPKSHSLNSLSSLPSHMRRSKSTQMPRSSSKPRLFSFMRRSGSKPALASSNNLADQSQLYHQQLHQQHQQQ